MIFADPTLKARFEAKSTIPSGFEPIEPARLANNVVKGREAITDGASARFRLRYKALERTPKDDRMNTGGLTGLAPTTASSRPLLFISHRHADKPIADVLRRFVKDRSGGRIDVFQSSSAEAANPRIGRELQTELKKHLWAAGVVVLVYTSPEEDWSYCMWECGVATHPASPETKVIVLQCGQQPPAVYGDAVRVTAQDSVSIQTFTNAFLTSSEFFPDYGEAIAPGFSANGEEVRLAASQLHKALEEVVPNDAEEGEDWPTVPFLRLQLTFREVDEIRKLDALQGARAVMDAARVDAIDGEAKRLFGLGRVERLASFRSLVDAWQQGRPEASTRWIDDLAEQLRVGSNWKYPKFTWQLLNSVDDADRAKYVPILSRVRSVPRQQCHHFDVYFNKFDTDEGGAIRIGFAQEPQSAPGAIPSATLESDAKAASFRAAHEPVDPSQPSEVEGWQDVSDSTAMSVLEALASTETRQRYRTVDGLAQQTGLAHTDVQDVLDNYPQFVQRSSLPTRDGEPCLDLFRLIPGVTQGDKIIGIPDQNRRAGCRYPGVNAGLLVPDPGGLFHPVQSNIQ